MDRAATIDDATENTGLASVVTDPAEGERLKRRAKRLSILAVIACPCHLPLVATVLAVVGFGGSAAALRDNLLVVSVVFGIIAVASLWMAVRSTRAANVCRLPPPPAQRVLQSSGEVGGVISHDER